MERTLEDWEATIESSLLYVNYADLNDVKKVVADWRRVQNSYEQEIATLKAAQLVLVCDCGAHHLFVRDASVDACGENNG